MKRPRTTDLFSPHGHAEHKTYRRRPKKHLFGRKPDHEQPMYVWVIAWTYLAVSITFALYKLLPW